MKWKLFVLISGCLALSLLCIAQSPAIATSAQSAATSTHDVTEIRQLMSRLQQASATENAKAYASCFDNNASWEGPNGESALGTANIERAMLLIYRSFGPAQSAEWGVRWLSPTLSLVDWHEFAQNLPIREDTASAPGSIRVRGNVRTTLLLDKASGTWRVRLARVAVLRDGDLRARDARAKN